MKSYLGNSELLPLPRATWNHVRHYYHHHRHRPLAGLTEGHQDPGVNPTSTFIIPSSTAQPSCERREKTESGILLPVAKGLPRFRCRGRSRLRRSSAHPGTTIAKADCFRHQALETLMKNCHPITSSGKLAFHKKDSRLGLKPSVTRLPRQSFWSDQ